MTLPCAPQVTDETSWDLPTAPATAPAGADSFESEPGRPHKVLRTAHTPSRPPQGGLASSGDTAARHGATADAFGHGGGDMWRNSPPSMR